LTLSLGKHGLTARKFASLPAKMNYLLLYYTEQQYITLYLQ